MVMARFLFGVIVAFVLLACDAKESQSAPAAAEKPLTQATWTTNTVLKTSPVVCIYADKLYSQGAWLCGSNTKLLVCEGGAWNNLNVTSCSVAPAKAPAK
jgi:hypothetical protein